MAPHSLPSPLVPFKRGLFWSVGLHSLLLILIFWGPQLSFLQPSTKVVWVDLPKGVSEQIDLKIKETKTLPETTIQEQKEWLKQQEEVKKTERQKAEPKKEEPKIKAVQPEPKPKPKPKPPTPEQKALAALERKIKAAPPEAAQVPEKGEGFKYGTSMQPLRVPPSDPEYIAYQARVRHKIIQEWILPLAYLEGEIPPKGRMVVMIDERGSILGQKWEQKSGNAAFDASCERAITRASPLPIPPERLKWEAYSEGFLVEFDPSLKSD